MLFFSAIFLSIVQLAFLASSQNDPCFYGVTYCLNRDGSTECIAETVARVSFRAGHADESEHLSVTLLGYHSKQHEPVTLFLGFNINGKLYSLYCPFDGKDTYTPTGTDAIWAPYDFTCSWSLDVTASSAQIAPVTNHSISIDLATIDDNVPLTLSHNDVKAVVAPNLKQTLIHQLNFLDCWEENRESFFDSGKENRVLLMKKAYNKEMQTFIYGLVPDTKSTDRSVKFVNADGVTLTVSCDKSFSTLTGFVQKGETKEPIDKLFTFKSLDGYRCGFKLPLLVQTDNIKFNFDSRPIDFSFSSASGSSVSKPNLKFDTDDRNWG